MSEQEVHAGRPSFRVASASPYARCRRPPPINPQPLINMINEVNNINEIGFKASLVAALQLTQFHSEKKSRLQ